MIFSDTGAAAFLKCSVDKLFAQCRSLDEFSAGWQVDCIIKRLKEAKTDADRVGVIEDSLLSRMDREINDKLITSAVDLIKQHSGDIRITLLSQKLNISQSQLEKRFRRMVGATPKKFATIVRLRHILSLASKETKMTRLGLEAGYFDQSHFTKGFKSAMGVTPRRYFKAK